MRILALEPYYGGSHRAFIDGWVSQSRHDFTLLTLPPHHFKWRMRHSAVTLAEEVEALWHNSVESGLNQAPWDLIWCSSMLNLAEFISLLPRALRGLPSVAYFHENQLVYPSEHPEPRDVHFAFTNWTTACCADAVWYNSAYNLTTLCSGLEALFRKMPDQRPRNVPKLLAKAQILPPGIHAQKRPSPTPAGSRQPLHIVWAARFEHDKNPADLFAAMRRVLASGVSIRLSVVGEQFANVPAIFEDARVEFASSLAHFGYQPRQVYEQLLSSADVVVSTAQHEFFGIAVLEAVARGCVPLLPKRLVYPELFADDEAFYDGTAEHLARRIVELAERKQSGKLEPSHWAAQVERFEWRACAAALDQAAQDLAC